MAAAGVARCHALLRCLSCWALVKLSINLAQRHTVSNEIINNMEGTVCCASFRPLLGVTWPEMVRSVLQGHPLTQDAATASAFKTLKARP